MPLKQHAEGDNNGKLVSNRIQKLAKGSNLIAAPGQISVQLVSEIITYPKNTRAGPQDIASPSPTEAAGRPKSCADKSHKGTSATRAQVTIFAGVQMLFLGTRYLPTRRSSRQLSRR